MTPVRDRILAVLLLCASVLVVTLSRKVVHLGDQVAAKERFSASHAEVGSRLPPLQTTTLAGDSVTIGHPANGERQLLLVFNTTCGYCKSSLWAWRAIAEELAASTSQNIKVYGVSLDSASLTRPYLRSHHLQFPTIVLTDPILQAGLRIGGVPTTILLGDSGRVLHVHHGSFGRGAAVDSLRRELRQAPLLSAR